jgi:hypothetical protein
MLSTKPHTRKIVRTQPPNVSPDNPGEGQHGSEIRYLIVDPFLLGDGYYSSNARFPNTHQFRVMSLATGDVTISRTHEENNVLAASIGTPIHVHSFVQLFLYSSTTVAIVEEEDYIARLL